MTSQRQIEANRRNAVNSTGPRTTRGKAVVALNAVQHGLLSRQAVIQGESEAELVDLGKRLRSQLAPVGELELLLADPVLVHLVAPVEIEPEALVQRVGDGHRRRLVGRPGDDRLFPRVGYPPVSLLGARLHFEIPRQVPCFAGLEGGDRLGPKLPDVAPQFVDVDACRP